MKHLQDAINEALRKTLLWIDDIRDPHTGDWIRKYSPIGVNVNVVWVKSYNDCVEWITKNGLPDAICFDHDLGDIHSKQEKTGYDCAKWIADYCMDNNLKYPPYNIQSDNGPGRENIHKYIENYKKHCE